MPIDPVGTLGPRIQKLLRDADAFLGFLQLGNLHPHYQRNSEWEIEGARKVRNLVDSLRSLEIGDLQVRAQGGMNRLKRLLFALIERWGWDRLVSPGGEAFLSERERLRNENRRSYYAAILSHVWAFAVEDISQRPSDGYFDRARTAEDEGIPRATPPVLRAEDLESLGKAWIHSPYLAPEFPTLKEGEMLAVETAIRDLRDGTRDQCTLQPALIEANRRAEEELMEARRCDPLPSPDRLTVGEMIDALRVQEVVRPAIGTSKTVFEQWNRRQELLNGSLGFREFKSWAQRTHGRDVTLEIAQDFRGRLATHLNNDFDQIHPMLLLDAVRLLIQPGVGLSPVVTRPPEEDDAPTGPAAPPWEVEPAAAEAGNMPSIGNQAQRLHDEIVKAFILPELEQLVRHDLNERLDAIAGSGPLSEVVFKLMGWAERHGRTEELVRAIQRARPHNQAIQSVTNSLLSN